jgi:hypothetical protein
MIYPIVRLYDSAARAAEAVRKLADWGFLDEDIDVVGPDQAPNDDAAVAAIAKACVLRSDAAVYARGVRRGGTLVILRAPFGTGGTASDLLDECGPIDAGMAYREARPHGWDDAAPLSSALRMPTGVSSHDSFSAYWSLPLLSRTSRTLCSALGWSELSDSEFALFGRPGLSRNAAPFSNALKLPLLMR